MVGVARRRLPTQLAAHAQAADSELRVGGRCAAAQHQLAALRVLPEQLPAPVDAHDDRVAVHPEQPWLRVVHRRGAHRRPENLGDLGGGPGIARRTTS